ncbi:hypothetical protein AB6A40_006204 [Gnathostoma spinigerum]|uniref:Uncharacterized protein n=1 Tax=Gnathostoma spinigerum TaxID=75299 RepID=A0ABD6EIU8_9BILA
MTATTTMKITINGSNENLEYVDEENNDEEADVPIDYDDEPLFQETSTENILKFASLNRSVLGIINEEDEDAVREAPNMSGNEQLENGMTHNGHFLVEVDTNLPYLSSKNHINQNNANEKEMCDISLMNEGRLDNSNSSTVSLDRMRMDFDESSLSSDMTEVSSSSNIAKCEQLVFENITSSTPIRPKANHCWKPCDNVEVDKPFDSQLVGSFSEMRKHRPYRSQRCCEIL